MENGKFTFSMRIKELRSNLDLTQMEFADKIGTTQATLSSYENTDKTPSLDIVKNIAEKFNISIDWLLGLSNIINPNETPRTYSDIIQLILKIESANILGFHAIAYYDRQRSKNIAELSFADSKIVDFFEEWTKMKEMHDKLIVDDELYALWIEKTLKKYNSTISSPIVGFMNIPDGIDDELPFN